MNFEKKLSALLSSHIEPYFNLPLKFLPLKPTFDLNENYLTVRITTNFPVKLLEEELKASLLESLRNAFPHLTVDISIDQFIQAHKTQLPGKALKGVKNTIAVASGKGGVGKSTIAVNLAIALAKAGAKVGILDADIYGPSIPLMLGKNSEVKVHENRYLPAYAQGVYAMSIGYLTDGEPALIWRGPMLAKSLLHMMDLTDWNELDYLFIDLPPGTGDIQLSLVQKIPLTGAIIVTTPQTVATLDAQKALQMFEKTNIDVLGIIENMSLHICTQCGHTETIFGTEGALKLCENFRCKLLGQFPLDTNIRQDCDNGKPSASNDGEIANLFLKTALQTSLVIAEKPLNYAGKFPPVISASESL